MKLRKCKNCNKYTLKERCSKCSRQSEDGHYKFLRLKPSEVTN